MEKTTIIEFTGRDAIIYPLTDLLRKDARELLQAAVEAERDAFFTKLQNDARRTTAQRDREQSPGSADEITRRIQPARIINMRKI